ncbi:hypothetical protein [Bacillus piscicola]|uniref:hypothetical protein n=1 Tax=Bacillus piscicola TaxID=1632684 RepID=UPI001F09DB36|nr:hypothetical protein [Bacillus piscicola]
MAKEVLSVFQDGRAIVVVLPSYSYHQDDIVYGQVLVRVEKLASDLFVTHECGVVEKNKHASCPCVEAAINAYLTVTQETYEDVVLEEKKIILAPDMKQLS